MRGNGKQGTQNLLSCDEDLEYADDVCQRNGLVGNPLLGRLCIVDEDYEIVLLALEVDLDPVCFTASHDCLLAEGGVRRRVLCWFG
jgi:hypothetical protein